MCSLTRTNVLCKVTKFRDNLCVILLLDIEPKMCYNKELCKKRRATVATAPPKIEVNMQYTQKSFLFLCKSLILIFVIMHKRRRLATSALFILKFHQTFVFIFTNIPFVVIVCNHDLFCNWNHILFDFCYCKVSLVIIYPAKFFSYELEPLFIWY